MFVFKSWVMCVVLNVNTTLLLSPGVARGAENCIYSNLPCFLIVLIINLACQFSRILSEIIPCLRDAFFHQRKDNMKILILMYVFFIFLTQGK